VIDTLVDTGLPAKICCRVLGVSSPGYFKYRKRPISPTQMRRQWLAGLIREVHIASRGTYGSRRVHAELTLGMGLIVSDRLVALLMHNAGIYGLPGPARVKRLRGVVTASDLVNRKFHRLSPNELWVTDITEHPTREGKLYCCCVLDTLSRRIVGWSIHSVQNSFLVITALDMAIQNRDPGPGGIVHADHGPQFTSWVFTDRIRRAGLVPSFGLVGDGLDKRDDGIVLVDNADRAVEPPAMEDSGGARQRHVRLHRDLLQSPPPPLSARLPFTDRVRSRLRQTTNHRLIFTPQRVTELGGRSTSQPIWGQTPST
jgi:putative transposase